MSAAAGTPAKKPAGASPDGKPPLKRQKKQTDGGAGGEPAPRKPPKTPAELKAAAALRAAKKALASGSMEGAGVAAGSQMDGGGAEGEEGEGAKDAEEEEIDELEPETERAEDNERMKEILANFTPEQMERYRFFRNSKLGPSKVLQLMQSRLASGVAGDKVPELMRLVMGGIAKVFVGELVEAALAVRAEFGDASPQLQPSHVREAYRRMRAAGKVPTEARPPLMKR